MAGFSHLDTWHDGQLASVRGPLACAAWSAMPVSFEITVRQRPGGVSRKIPPSVNLVGVSAQVDKEISNIFPQNIHSPDEEAEEDGQKNPCSEKPIIVA
jgi:hypothetical protein